MSAFRVWFRGKDGKTHTAVADGKVTFGPSALAKVKRTLRKRHQVFRVRRVDKPTPGDHIMRVSAKFVGQCEHPAGSNWSPFIAKCLAYVGWRVPAPWCAAFCCYMLWLAGYPLPYVSASVPALERWAREHGRWVNAGGLIYPLPGWLVVMQFDGDAVADHIGFVRRPLRDRLLTREGNTSNAEAGSQSNGGTVADRNRSQTALAGGRHIVKGYIRTW